MKVLAVSAHPDDEVIGAGGTLIRHVERGDEIHWAIFTQAYSPPFPANSIEVAAAQVEAVKDRLGMASVHRFGFPTVKLNTVPQIELATALQKVMDSVCPQVVYTTPRADINQDHRIVHDITLVATRPFPGCSVKRVLSYENGPTTRFGVPSGGSPFNPTVYVDITRHLAQKLELMELYASELRPFPHPRSCKGLEILAHERGLTIGVEAAECFELVREIID